MTIPNKGPISGDMVCSQYGIKPEDWQKMSIAERALFRMAFQVDVMRVQEDPRGSNRGPEVDRVLTLAGVDPGNPWCAADWTAMLIDSGAHREHLPENPASVHGWGEWAKEHGLDREEPARSFAGLIYHTATTGHLVAIAGVDGRKVRTIEGNSNDEGSREGYESCRRLRSIGEFAMFVDCGSIR